MLEKEFYVDIFHLLYLLQEVPKLQYLQKNQQQHIT